MLFFFFFFFTLGLLAQGTARSHAVVLRCPMMRVIPRLCISARAPRPLLAGCGSRATALALDVSTAGPTPARRRWATVSGPQAMTRRPAKTGAHRPSTLAPTSMPGNHMPPTPDQRPSSGTGTTQYLSPTSTTGAGGQRGRSSSTRPPRPATGLAFWDSARTFANRQGWSTRDNLATVVKYAQSKGLTVLAAGAPIEILERHARGERSEPRLEEREGRRRSVHGDGRRPGPGQHARASAGTRASRAARRSGSARGTLAPAWIRP